MTDKVLLAGSSYSALPIMEAMKRRGWQVHVAGSLPEDPCHAASDGSHFLDYSQTEPLLKAVQENGFEYLCPSCNDYSYIACAWVAEQTGLPGFDSPETTQILHNKIDFRRFTESNGFPVPKSFAAKDLQDAAPETLPYPLLVKPVDSFSGRGMSKVSAPDEIESAIRAASKESRRNSVVGESFIEGSLHSHSAFIKDGTILIDFFVDEYCTVYPYQVDSSHYPSALGEDMQQQVRACMADLISSLQLTDGLLHTQFMVEEERFWLIECMRRAPGDLYYKMIGLATGIDGMDLYALPFIGERLPSAVEATRAHSIARHTISVSEPVAPISFSIDLACEDLQIVPLKLSGQELKPAPHDKLAIFFARFTDRERMIRITPDLKNRVRLQGAGV